MTFRQVQRTIPTFVRAFAVDLPRCGVLEPRR